jgi:hypothetical protein
MFGLFKSAPTPLTPVTENLEKALRGDPQAWARLIDYLSKPNLSLSDADRELLRLQQTASPIKDEAPGARDTLLGICNNHLKLWSHLTENQRQKYTEDCFAKAAGAEFPEGLYHGGLWYKENFRSETARDYWDKACHDHNHCKATVALADLLRAEKDLHGAAKLYEAAMKVHNDGTATVRYASLSLGFADTSELKAAWLRGLLQAESAKGNGEASYALAAHYHAKKQYVEAIRWFEVTVTQNYNDAKIQLATLLIDGQGYQRDLKRGLILMRQINSYSRLHLPADKRKLFTDSADPETRYQYAMATNESAHGLPEFVKAPIEVLIDYVCNDDLLSLKDKYEKLDVLNRWYCSPEKSLSPAARVKIADAICKFARDLADAFNEKNKDLGWRSAQYTKIQDITIQQCLCLLDLIPKTVTNYDQCCSVFAGIAYDFASMTASTKTFKIIPLLHAYPLIQRGNGPECQAFFTGRTAGLFLTMQEVAGGKVDDFTLLVQRFFSLQTLPLLLTEMRDFLSDNIAQFEKLLETEISDPRMPIYARGASLAFIPVMNLKIKPLMSAINAAFPDPEPKRRQPPVQQLAIFEDMLTKLQKSNEDLLKNTIPIIGKIPIHDFEATIQQIDSTGKLFSANLKAAHPELFAREQQELAQLKPPAAQLRKPGM